MLLGTRCTICGDRVAVAETTSCDTCSRRVHDRCREFETAFSCRQCADEPWIGAVEF
jgi:hypothetical protein